MTDWNVLSDAGEVLRVAVSTTLLYVYLVLLLRLTGNRTLATLRAFDLVVVIAIGSLLASTVLTNVPLANGVVAITLLVLLQLTVAHVARWDDRLNTLVTSPPTLLYYDGRYQGGLASAGLTRREVQLAMRQEGYRRDGDVLAVVLETNGNLSVLGRSDGGTGEADTFAGLEDDVRRARSGKA